MNTQRLDLLRTKAPSLRIGILGDFCLDRYLDIDFGLHEISLETGLPVFNVIATRPQAGGAGTILNNLAALGIGSIRPLGFVGEDGEGWELQRTLSQVPGVQMEGCIQTPLRRTFTYTKPMAIMQAVPPRWNQSGEASRPGSGSAPPRQAPTPAPKELNRLDFKNWTPTPEAVENQLIEALQAAAPHLDGLILLDQVDQENTGVLTQRVLEAVTRIQKAHPSLRMLADSRRGLQGFPPVSFKMNGVELGRLLGDDSDWRNLERIHQIAVKLVTDLENPVYITLEECGIVGAAPDGTFHHSPALPIRGEMDIVGAGDAVTSAIMVGTLSGLEIQETLDLANAAASICIHKLGTTGTATLDEIQSVMEE